MLPQGRQAPLPARGWASTIAAVEELRFACDAMLGRLARWLRLAGFDTRFDPAATDQELAAACRAEGRWLLTRDRRLASLAGPRVLLLRSGRWPEQFVELGTRLPLVSQRERWLSRCPRCNTPLRAAMREAVSLRVPPYVAAHAAQFRECPGCGQVYWEGTHVARIHQRLAALLPRAGISGRCEEEGDR
jgi:uncharacterized protein with PIN domain